LRAGFAPPDVFAALVERLAVARFAAGLRAAEVRLAPVRAVVARAVVARFAVERLAVERFAVLRFAAGLRAPADRPPLAVPAPESSEGHLPVITRCAASATASAISEPNLVALAIMLVAA
jgi:hypothetical protein